MTAAMQVQQLTALGVRLEARDGQLIVDAPKGVLTPELLTKLREHKAEILAELSAEAVSGRNEWLSRAAYYTACEKEARTIFHDDEAADAWRADELRCRQRAVGRATRTDLVDDVSRWHEPIGGSDSGGL